MLNIKIIVGRGVIGLTLLGQGVSAAQGVQQDVAAALAFDGGRIQRLSLAVDNSPSADLIQESLADRGGILSPVSRTVLWSGPLVVPGWAEGMSTERTADGQRVIVSTVHGGGSRLLSFWTFGADPIVVGEPRAAEVQQAFVTTVSLQRSQIPEDLTGSTLVDLHGATLMLVRGEVHVIGVGHAEKSMLAPGSEWVWIAPLSSVQRGTLAGRVIARGIDPVVARIGTTEVVLALRLATDAWMERHEAPVEFYRTSDLATWDRDARLSTGVVARAAFVFHVSEDAASVVSWTDGETLDSPARAPELRLNRLESGGRPWASSTLPTASTYRGTMRPDGLWLMTGTSGEKVELILDRGDGQLQRTSL